MVTNPKIELHIRIPYWRWDDLCFSIRSWWTLAHMHTKKCVYQRHMLPSKGYFIVRECRRSQFRLQKPAKQLMKKKPACHQLYLFFWRSNISVPKSLQQMSCPFPKVGYLRVPGGYIPIVFLFSSSDVKWQSIGFDLERRPLTRSNSSGKTAVVLKGESCEHTVEGGLRAECS